MVKKGNKAAGCIRFKMKISNTTSLYRHGGVIAVSVEEAGKKKSTMQGKKDDSKVMRQESSFSRSEREHAHLGRLLLTKNRKD